MKKHILAATMALAAGCLTLSAQSSLPARESADSRATTAEIENDPRDLVAQADTQPEAPEKPERPEKPEKPEKPERPEAPERAEARELKAKQKALKQAEEAEVKAKERALKQKIKKDEAEKGYGREESLQLDLAKLQALKQQAGRNEALYDAGAITEQAMELAEKAVRDAEEAGRSAEFFFEPARREGSQPGTVVINTTQTNEETLGSIHEDLSVMSRILDKLAFGGIRQGQDAMMGIWIPGFQGSRGSENLYVEGQGAILIRHVKFALMPKHTKEVDEAAAKKDSAWDEAKSELYGPKEGRAKITSDNHGEFSPYAPDRVEALKREIVGALRYAANIRGLGANESVTVVLLGTKEGTLRGRLMSDDSRNNKRGREARGDVSPKATYAVREAATLTIRVKKADAEAALKGSIDMAEFQKRATVSVY